MSVIIVEYFKVIATGTETCLYDLEMNGRHLRTENRIILTHFFRKLHFCNGTGTDGSFLMFLFSDFNGREQGTYTDSGST